MNVIVYMLVDEAGDANIHSLPFYRRCCIRLQLIDIYVLFHLPPQERIKFLFYTQRTWSGVCYPYLNFGKVGKSLWFWMDRYVSLMHRSKLGVEQSEIKGALVNLSRLCRFEALTFMQIYYILSLYTTSSWSYFNIFQNLFRSGKSFMVTEHFLEINQNATIHSKWPELNSKPQLVSLLTNTHHLAKLTYTQWIRAISE